MSDNNSEHVQEPYLPYVAVIPYRVQCDDNLPDSVKLYFGQLTALCQNGGYCWATDAWLSKMKKVPIGTIKEWNRKLEQAGYITRVTKNVSKGRCPKTNRDIWRKERKIFVNDAFAREKVSTPKVSKNVSKVWKSRPAQEGLKNQTYNSKTLSEKQQRRGASPVVASSEKKEQQADPELSAKQELLKEFNFPKKQLDSLTAFPKERIETALHAYKIKLQSDTIDNPRAWVTAAVKNGYVHVPTKKEKAQQAQAAAALKEENYFQESYHAEQQKKNNHKAARSLVDKYKENFNEKYKVNVFSKQTDIISPQGVQEIFYSSKDWKKTLENSIIELLKTKKKDKNDKT